MNKDLLVSVIIPTYNTPKEYILKCINSICKQPYKFIEILIIDDGSEKEYFDNLNQIKYLDDRIQIIHKHHSGVSDTRNKGIIAAKGEYITFVDADDQIPMHFIINAVSMAKKYNYPDLIIGGIEYQPYRKCNSTQFGENEDLYSDSDIDLLKKSLLHIRDSRVKYNILGSPCGKIYKRNLVKNISFPSEVALCEDQIFNRKVLLQVKTALVVPEMWYVYQQNNFSVMHTKVKKNHWEMKKKYWDELYKLDAVETNSIKDGLKGMYIRSFFNVASIYCKDKEIAIKTKKRIIKEAMRHPLIKIAVKELNLKSQIPIDWKIQLLLLKLGFFTPIYLLAHFIN